MKSIRTRVSAMAAFAFTVLISFGFVTYSSFDHFRTLQREMALSYEIVDDGIALEGRQLSVEKKDALSKKADALNPEFRSTALKNLIKSPNRENLNFLLRTEGEYRKYTLPFIAYYEKSVSYLGSITLGSALLLVFLLLTVIIKQVFHPLGALSAKMDDFMHDKYSYEFEVPEPNEVGQLHSTFNNMAQKVLSQIDELQQLDKAKSEFLSIASHELRTPLTSIKGSLSLLHSGVAGQINEATKNLMTIALNETDRLIRLINEILDLAKIEARQFPLNSDWVSARELTTKTFQSLKGFCETANVSLNCVGDDDVDLFIDSDRIQQVLTNLLSNAVKYSPKKSSVTVKYIVNETNEMRVEVSDRGPGISPEDQEIIFEKFRQATSPKNPLVKGTGLGLAIAKALVEQHGGTIGVISLPGEGSTFYFTLPKWRPHLDKQSAQAAS